MTKRIGYLVPEFPGQTHTFFWREIKALELRGVEVDIVSSRKPRTMPQPHGWTAEAESRTTYLFPPSSITGAIVSTLVHSPSWWRCLRAVAKAEGCSVKQRIRMTPMIVMGAQLATLAKRRRWDHLHCHMCSDIANIAMFANLLAGTPYSLTLHAGLAEFGPNQSQKWGHAEFGIAITKILERELREQLGASVPDSIAVTPMGVDCEKLKRATPYQPWGGDGAAKLFSCGRLNPCKGHADVIDALKRLRERGFNATLRIAGEDELGGGGYRKTLEQKIAESRLEPHVTLLGAIGEDQVRQELDDAHLFVLGSHGEPFGIATAEAMAMETPVVTTRAGGVVELLRDRQDGILTPPQAPDAMADEIANLLADPNLSRSLAACARERVVEHFSSQRSADVLLEYINELRGERLGDKVPQATRAAGLQEAKPTAKASPLSALSGT